MNIQGWFSLGLTGLISFQYKGFKSLLQHHSSKASIFWPFFMVQLSHPHITTGKTMAFSIWTFIGKVMSLLFNTLCSFVMAFLPRSKRLSVSWLQSPFAVILEPKKIICHCFHSPPLICHEWRDHTPWSSFFWMFTFKSPYSLFSFSFVKNSFVVLRFLL